MVCESIHTFQWPDLASQEFNTSPVPAADDTLNSSNFPYWTLAHPVVYKLRTCCLVDFIPHITPEMKPDEFFSAQDNNPFYVTKRLQLPESGVAYLFRGRKYLLVEDIDHPAAKYTTFEPLPSSHIEKEVGLYELVQIDPRDILEFPKDTPTSFIFSFNCQPKPKNKHKNSPPDSATCVDEFPCLTTSVGNSSSSGSTSPSVKRVALEIQDSAPTQRQHSDSEPNQEASPMQTNQETESVQTPCECQIIRQRQLIHRQIFCNQMTRFVSYITALIETYGSTFPPFVRAAVLRCEVGNYFSEIMRRSVDCRPVCMTDPTPFPTQFISRFLNISEVPLKTCFPVREDDEFSSSMNKITTETHAQLMVNELKEMFQILQHYANIGGLTLRNST